MSSAPSPRGKRKISKIRGKLKEMKKRRIKGEEIGKKGKIGEKKEKKGKKREKRKKRRKKEKRCKLTPFIGA